MPRIPSDSGSPQGHQIREADRVHAMDFITVDIEAYQIRHVSKDWFFDYGNRVEWQIQAF